MSADPPRIGFLGAGKMATALARGWIAAGFTVVGASDPVVAAQTEFTAATGKPAGESNSAVAAASDVLVLAVKPQNMDEVVGQLRGKLAQRHLVISIAAGVSIERLAAGLGPMVRLIRVMPNTPCLVQASAAAYSAAATATPADIALVDRLLNTVGQAVAVPEKLLDAVTGLSGSGPAFVYLAIEALSDGGVLMGLPRDIATTLAAQTVLGAAKMVLETGLHPGVLKDQVTSPGGTTIAGLHALELAGVRAGFIDAVAAAARRAQELGGN